MITVGWKPIKNTAIIPDDKLHSLRTSLNLIWVFITLEHSLTEPRNKNDQIQRIIDEGQILTLIKNNVFIAVYWLVCASSRFMALKKQIKLNVYCMYIQDLLYQDIVDGFVVHERGYPVPLI